MEPLTLVGPFAWYARRSDNKSDLERQRMLLSAFCEKHHISVAEQLRYEDTGSRDQSNKRASFQRMIEDAQNKKFKTILVQCLDRFGIEDFDEAGHYRLILNRAGVTLFSTDPDEGDLTAKDLMTFMKIFMKAEASRVETQKKGGRSITGKINQLKQAVSFMGGPCPYGYDKQCVTSDGELLWTLHYLTPGKRVAHMPDGATRNFFGNKNTHPVKARSDRVLLVPSRDTSRVETIKTMFEMWVKFDLPILGICKRLNTAGHRHYGELWKPTAVRDILANAVYTGATVFNKRKWGRFASYEGGEEVHHAYKDKYKKYVRTPDKWLVYPDTHTALIDPETWEKADAKLKSLSKSKTLPPRHADLWLRRFAVCGHCNQPMQARHTNKTAYLFCGKTKKEKSIGAPLTCTFNMVRADALEALVIGHFTDIFRKLLDQDEHALEVLNRKVDQEYGLIRAGLSMLKAEMVPLALKLGIPTDPPASVWDRIRDAGERDPEVKTATNLFIKERDDRIKAELADLEDRHTALTEKWALASPAQAPKLKLLCDQIEGQMADLKGRLVETILADARARMAAMAELVDQVKALNEQFSVGDGAAKSEALRPLLSRIRLFFKEKTKAKAKSKLERCEFVYCDSSSVSVTALRAVLLQLLAQISK